MTSGELELAGWRRTVAELYAAVRAQDDPRCAHELWRHGRDDLFRSHPQSPLPPGDPLRATGLPYWPYDPGLRFELPLLPAEEELSLSVPTSDGVIPMDRIGCLRLPSPLDAVIDVWWLRQYAGCCRCATAPRASPATAAAGTRWTPPRAPTWAE
jgi:hypothetical protein